LILMLIFVIFFFFQAEDGIRDGHVTGVQTCALPISSAKLADAAKVLETQPSAIQLRYLQTLTEIGVEKNTTIVFPLPIDIINKRSEERRVGKECRSRWSQDH